MKHEAGENGGFRRVWSQSEYSTGGEIIKFHNRRPIGERRTAGLNPPVRSPFSRVVGGYTAGFGGFGGYDSNASGLQGACGEETRGVEAELWALFQLNSPLACEDCGRFHSLPERHRPERVRLHRLYDGAGKPPSTIDQPDASASPLVNGCSARRDREATPSTRF